MPEVSSTHTWRKKLQLMLRATPSPPQGHWEPVKQHLVTPDSCSVSLYPRPSVWGGLGLWFQAAPPKPGDAAGPLPSAYLGALTSKALFASSFCHSF